MISKFLLLNFWRNLKNLKIEKYLLLAIVMQGITCNLNFIIHRPAISVELYRSGFKLAGISIGNGWVDPIKQYPSYARYSYTNYFIDRSKFLKYQDSY